VLVDAAVMLVRRRLRRYPPGFIAAKIGNAAVATEAAVGDYVLQRSAFEVGGQPTNAAAGAPEAKRRLRKLSSGVIGYAETLWWAALLLPLHLLAMYVAQDGNYLCQ